MRKTLLRGSCVHKRRAACELAAFECATSAQTIPLPLHYHPEIGAPINTANASEWWKCLYLVLVL